MYKILTYYKGLSKYFLLITKRSRIFLHILRVCYCMRDKSVSWKKYKGQHAKKLFHRKVCKNLQLFLNFCFAAELLHVFIQHKSLQFQIHCFKQVPALIFNAVQDLQIPQVPCLYINITPMASFLNVFLFHGQSSHQQEFFKIWSIFFHRVCICKMNFSNFAYLLSWDTDVARHKQNIPWPIY